jgi:hypothetical protein
MTGLSYEEYANAEVYSRKIQRALNYNRVLGWDSGGINHYDMDI